MYARSLVWPIAALLVVLLYLPGIAGPFLFDDFSNLDALGAHGGITSWESLRLYLSQGHSGPTGRPISLISFLINDNGWPSVAASFKYTNIIIHALNGCLLFWIQLKLLAGFQSLTERQRLGVALVGSFLWLAHPLFVSTVLYVVQRMAMLAATFVLAGILSHLYLRTLVNNNPRGGYWGMTLSLGLWGSLAILSKENGALLPVLILVIESTVYSNSQRLKDSWKAFFLWGPTLLMLGYLIYVPVSNGFWDKWPARDFSPYERLITESRIIWDYVFGLYSFQGTEGGLFHDDYVLSRSIWFPISTLFSSIGIVASLLWAIYTRRRWPLLSLAILFFLAGHLVESTSIGLELYFEHRNYLPAVFAFLPLSVALIRSNGSWKWAATPTLLILVAMLLFNRVDLWSNNVALAMAWAKEAPNSVRAQRSAAIALTQEGHLDDALHILGDASERMPESHAILIHKIILKCSFSMDIESDKRKLLPIARDVSFNPKLTKLVEKLIVTAASGVCPQLTEEYAYRVLDALMDNPKSKQSKGFLHQIFYFRGMLDSYEGLGVQAEENFRKAIDLRPRPALFMRSIALLASQGHCQQALDLAGSYAERLSPEQTVGSVEEQYYKKELEIMKGNISNHCFSAIKSEK